MNELIIYLAALFIIPLLPAFILYKFLPSRTNVTGPFKGLDLKLTGAFAGYFILVLVGSTIFFTLYNKQNIHKTAFNYKQAEVDSLNRVIKELEAQLRAPFENNEEWTIAGKVESSIPEQTRVFFDDDTRGFYSTGRFELSRRCALKNGKPILPFALCIFNKTDGYKVIDLSKNLNSGDLTAFDIQFKEEDKTILINNPIDIRSKQRDSINYINNYAEKVPEVKEAISRVNPEIFKLKATINASTLDKVRRIGANRITDSLRR